jgi:very-short-patch-repair endonuclease
VRERTVANLPTEIALLSAEEADSPSIRYALNQGALVKAARRVVMPAEFAPDPRAWIIAVHQSDPDLPVSGLAALWSTRSVEPKFPITAISPVRRRDTAQVRFLRTTAVPYELLLSTSAGTCTIDELSVLVCAILGDFAPACDALREGWVTPATLIEAVELLAPNSWLGRRARSVLKELSGAPWSVAELDLHRLLREAGISGWEGNRPLHPGDDASKFPDLTFRKHGLLVEVNGIEFHCGAEAVEKDIRRIAEFMLEGWEVVVVTPSMIRESPRDVLDLIRLQLRSHPIRGNRRNGVR